MVWEVDRPGYYKSASSAGSLPADADIKDLRDYAIRQEIRELEQKLWLDSLKSQSKLLNDAVQTLA